MLQKLARRGDGRSLISRLRFLSFEGAGEAGVVDVRTGPRFRLGIFGWSLSLCVLLPTLASFTYLLLSAPDEYVSEAHFTIRQASESNTGITDALTKLSSSIGMGAIPNSTTQDIYIVADYIRSRSIIDDIGGTPVLFAIYARPDVDWLSRLPAGAPLEKAWKYWKSKVTATIDTPSGIVTLDVRAFRRDDAQRLAQLVLKKSEALVNDISERSRQDALGRARSEVKAGEERLQKARAALLAFRNKTNIIDPALTAKSIGDTIGKLTQDRIMLENNRAGLGSSPSPDLPTVRVLNAQIAAIDQQISGLQNQLTSESQKNALSGQIAGYENLQLEVQFAEKLYSIAQDSYEAARRQQEKQQLYLVTVDRPSMPDKPTYPRVVIDTLTIFAGCLILWSMATLLIASVRDHMGG